jgi:hypothetical protein
MAYHAIYPSLDHSPARRSQCCGSLPALPSRRCVTFVFIIGFVGFIACAIWLALLSVMLYRKEA